MITAAPLTTKRNGKNFPTHVTIRAGEVEGIYQDSIISVESTMPVEKINFTKKLGLSMNLLNIKFVSALLYRFLFYKNG